jgi:hypothetical protein
MTTEMKTANFSDDPKEHPFRIRKYGKGELASRYMPDFQPNSALRRFNQWLQVAPELIEQLKETGWTPKARLYTPRQVEMSVGWLGEP